MVFHITSKSSNSERKNMKQRTLAHVICMKKTINENYSLHSFWQINLQIFALAFRTAFCRPSSQALFNMVVFVPSVCLCGFLRNYVNDLEFGQLGVQSGGKIFLFAKSLFDHIWWWTGRWGKSSWALVKIGYNDRQVSTNLPHECLDGCSHGYYVCHCLVVL